MQMMRESWTDERLNDLNGRVSDGFARVDADIRELRGDIKSLQRMMVQGFITMSAVMATGFVGLAGLIAF
ncbi:MAG TPA: hypothetical protein VGC49_04325 [Solirubrobacterales bacterium]|jgi:hypothetical protein